MKTYADALKVWASHRFRVPHHLIDTVELRDLEAYEGHSYSEYTMEPSTPARVEVTIVRYTGDRDAIDVEADEWVKIMAEVFAAGADDAEGYEGGQ